MIVTDRQATVQDYLESMNRFIEEQQGKRDILSCNAACQGCGGCCSERIPLTSVDFFKLAGQQALLTYLERYAYISLDGPAVDISLYPGGYGPCVFLDEETNLCRVYDHRPLVCQTYICIPSTGRAQQLRQTIVNVGEDELVRLWLLEGELSKQPLVYHEACEPAASLADYPTSPFTGKHSYTQVLLREICSPALWAEILRAG